MTFLADLCRGTFYLFVTYMPQVLVLVFVTPAGIPALLHLFRLLLPFVHHEQWDLGARVMSSVVLKTHVWLLAITHLQRHVFIASIEYVQRTNTLMRYALNALAMVQLQAAPQCAERLHES